eukprot:TRINITY_DN12598_c0_g1_i1.p1 TRINITY_DN12598_c0_g1~~TRINITY_DN12598_c0_g1_i1.p1  ORF type:complete len:351 (-),score=44.77 TRINITY_DN12598_c0_g1_i1:166-1143(-)
MVDEIYKSLQEAIQNQIREIVTQKEEFLKEREAFEETKKKISQVHSSDPIRLDVGGKVFKTSLKTIRKEDSMLSRMFSGNGFLVEKDADGSYFIDRPGKPFSTILSYLQTGVFLPPKDEVALKALKMEVDFYQIPSLVEYFNTTTLQVESHILTTEEQKDYVYKMLKPDLYKWRLLIDSAVHGSSASVFDNAVRGKSKILVVIHATNGYIFGAYVNDRFGTGGWVPGSTDTFLWSLQDNNNPLKLTYNGSGVSGHFGSCGLHLGASSNDLSAFCSNSCGNPTAFRHLAPGYDVSKKVDCNLLAGTSSWTPSRMEVFENVPDDLST